MCSSETAFQFRFQAASADSCVLHSAEGDPYLPAKQQRTAARVRLFPFPTFSPFGNAFYTASLWILRPMFHQSHALAAIPWRMFSESHGARLPCSNAHMFHPGRQSQASRLRLCASLCFLRGCAVRLSLPVAQHSHILQPPQCLICATPMAARNHQCGHSAPVQCALLRLLLCLRRRYPLVTAELVCLQPGTSSHQHLYRIPSFVYVNCVCKCCDCPVHQAACQ
jgi:hypothetical protein